MKGRIIDFSTGMNRKQRVTIELDDNFRSKYEKLKNKELDVNISLFRDKRSKSANSYFHILVNKIAEAVNLSETDVKKKLVLDYGSLLKDENGLTVGLKLPVSANVDEIYPYAKCFDTREEGGVKFNCYMAYKRTHKMNSKEMARLIDGAIMEAHEYGIETDTPEQIARYKREWIDNEHGA